MEHRQRVKIVLAIACATAVSLLFTVHRRRRKQQLAKQVSCYLENESKPQSSFKRVLTDNSYAPFKHLKLNPSDGEEHSSNLHPYESEIMCLVKDRQVDYYSVFDGITLKGLSDSYVWVASVCQLRELADKLSKVKCFGVDTEQHSLRSFLGFSALVQISTQEEDYLVDTIALHDNMDILRPVFADPAIVKVFHGSDNDVLWLQRDFHIYVVNMFDTAKACEVLLKPQKSLAYLLESYCTVTSNKLLQREDWRQRPLPEDMVEYARSDAHYLVYIARCLIEELRHKGNDISVPKNSACEDDRLHFLLEASRRSNMTCLQTYAKEDEVFPGESAASSLLSRNLSVRGFATSSCRDKFENRVRDICAWRDLMARVHDESLKYVLSDQAIVALAEKVPICEKEILKVIAEADHSTFPSPVICSHSDAICCLLRDDRGSSHDILQILLHKQVGHNGTCPLSIYNYNLLLRSNLKLEKATTFIQNGAKNGKKFGRKASRELFVQKFSCKAPVYHNCKIYANDGRLLCYCDRRKLEWYLSRNLAKLVNDNPPAIMLLFEPKGRPEDEGNDFYVQSKRNMCVGCGERSHYLRYRIIPSCYRMHFPEHLKSHRSHDIVLLCVDCHEVAHAAAEKYKRKIAAEFGIPLYVRKIVDSSEGLLPETSKSLAREEGVSPIQLRTAAMALMRHGARMPSKRREELTEIVRTYYGGREVLYEDLEAALLVGMNPQKRRKFEKKRSFLNKHSGARMFSSNIQENNSSLTPVHVNHFSKDTTSSSSRSLNTKDDTLTGLVVDKCSLPSESDVPGNHSCSDGISTTLTTSDATEVKYDIPTDAINDSQKNNASISTADIFVSNPGERTSKASLLGHGPHGKELVTHLLEEQGEDGIREFCQRWRQVFVDAVHPRHLPAGWDIKHSGKRDFGEFSVYNPAKRDFGDFGAM